MDAIKTYLDNVFSVFPNTERVRALKQEMLMGMEEKYHALKQEGRSEHEAVGNVIANFGSIDEIANELGIEQGAGPREEDISLSNSEVHSYLELTRKSATWIGLAVWLILTGVAAMLTINSLAIDTLGEEATVALGVLVLMIAIAAAVVLFIVSGIRMSKYDSYQKTKIQLDLQTRFELEEKSAQFAPRFTFFIASSVAFILVAVGVLVVLLEVASMSWESLPVALFVFVIGFPVFLLITAGMTKSSFDILLGKGDYARKADLNKNEKVLGAAAAGLFPLMVAVWLIWSFIGDAWQISWIVFPAAGILFGAFAGVVSTLTSSRDK